jgi:predicted lipid-binding transport protein (Tim44 family)
MSSRQNRLHFIPVAALAALLAFAPSLVEAKMGGSFGGGMGSRGSRTFSPPPATNTAPSQAAPIQRSVTPSAPQQGLGAPSAQQRPGFAPSGGLGRSFMGGLAGGLLGAGLFGLLTGQGFFGGMGGFASILGFLFQIALLAFLARLAFQWWQGRQTAAAGLGPRSGGNLFGFDPRAGFGGGAPQRPRAEPLQLSATDFPAFERLLGETQEAYSREDVNALAELATPEMVGYFHEELNERRRQGVINKISGVKLLQGDLAEAWREGSDEYATVAMRFALNDVTEDRATGRIVSGDPTTPTQATQVWTFRRPAGAPPEAWKLSAMQEAA